MDHCFFANNTQPVLWALDYVANVTHAEEIDDPNIQGKNALLVYVCLAKEDQWKDIEKPPLVRELVGIDN